MNAPTQARRRYNGAAKTNKFIGEKTGHGRPKFVSNPLLPSLCFAFHMPTAMSSLVLCYPQFSFPLYIRHSLLIGLSSSCKQCLLSSQNQTVTQRSMALIIPNERFRNQSPEPLKQHFIKKTDQIKSSKLTSVIIKASQIVAIGFLQENFTNSLRS